MECEDVKLIELAQEWIIRQAFVTPGMEIRIL